MVLAKIITPVGVFELLDTHQLIAPSTACGRDTIVTLDAVIRDDEAEHLGFTSPTVRDLIAGAMRQHGMVIKGRAELDAMLAGRLKLVSV